MKQQDPRRAIRQLAVVDLALAVFGVVMLTTGNTEGIAILFVAALGVAGLTWWWKNPNG
jgi:hypothetical protein